MMMKKKNTKNSNTKKKAHVETKNNTKHMEIPRMIRQPLRR